MEKRYKRMIQLKETILFILVLMIGPFSARCHDVTEYISASHFIESYHKDIHTVSAWEGDFSRDALDARPTTIAYHQSTLFPVRSHYPSQDLSDMAREILEIIEYSWTQQVLGMGFPAPPADCGNGGSDHLDVYIQELPQGIGGYAAFTCYLDETPEADAASFIVLSDTVPANLLKGAVTHEFNHVLQNAIDYWETITFKENTATWVMDRIYDDENAYFSYLRSYQRNPDWPMHKFSTTNTFQYGECIFLHFLAEYYGGDDPSIVVDIWNSARQLELANEPDYIDAMKEIIPRISLGRDSFNDALREFSVWRTIVAARDDQQHFHDGALWPDGAMIVPDTTVDISMVELPVTIEPQKAPYDCGFSYIRLENTSALTGALAMEFTGDSAVDWAVTVVQSRDDFTTHIQRSPEIDSGQGILLLNPGMLKNARDITICVVNLADEDYDPDVGDDGQRRNYSLRFFTAQPDSSLQLWLDGPMTCSGENYLLTSEIEHYGQSSTLGLWLFLEIAGSFYSVFTDQAGQPIPEMIPVDDGDVINTPLLSFTMPELSGSIPFVWHAAILNGSAVVDYRTLNDNLLVSCR